MIGPLVHKSKILNSLTYMAWKKFGHVTQTNEYNDIYLSHPKHARCEIFNSTSIGSLISEKNMFANYN